MRVGSRKRYKISIEPVGHRSWSGYDKNRCTVILYDRSIGLDHMILYFGVEDFGLIQIVKTIASNNDIALLNMRHPMSEIQQLASIKIKDNPDYPIIVEDKRK